MGKQIFLFRHGQPEEGAESMCRGAGIDAPLSRIGEDQTLQNVQYAVGQFGADMRNVLVGTSPLKRTSYFGSVFEKHYGVIPVSYDGFVDIHAGVWEGQYWSWIKQNFKKQYDLVRSNPMALEIPGATESVPEFVKRTVECFQALVRKSTASRIALCLHGSSISAILASIDGRTLQLDVQKIGAMNEIYVDDERMTVKKENQIVYVDRDIDESILQLAS